MYDIYGHELFDRHDLEQIRDMFSPVRCTCGSIYDLGKVEVTARYVDCSMWKAPCCGRVADDRGETGWKSTKDYYPIDKRKVLG
jgi:hypothetical protein